MRARCADAFRSREGTPSRLQLDVVGALRKLEGVEAVEEEVVTEEGYSIDALVCLPGDVRVAVEVDGPSHFLEAGTGAAKRTPSGTTRLKHRQLRAQGWQLVSVPYWEWDRLNASQRGPYLRGLLNATVP